MLISKVNKIWDVPGHAAFTDLIFYRNKFLLCFRESDAHAGEQDGTIRILTSADWVTWTSVALLAVPGIDLRDPMLSVMPNGSLMLSMDGLVYVDGQCRMKNPCVAFSEDGIRWNGVTVLDMPGEWIWRVTWHEGIGYGASYSVTDNDDLTKLWHLKLFKTLDGHHYTLITPLEVSEHPSETTLRFTAEGTMIALTRRHGNGWIGVSTPPYHQWEWTDIGYRLGGPNFLILPNQEMWAASRRIKKSFVFFGEPKASVVVARMGVKKYRPMLTLPSGGDCGYPGMVYLNGKLYISYYSSHEGKACIYLATVSV